MNKTKDSEVKPDDKTEPEVYGKVKVIDKNGVRYIYSLNRKQYISMVCFNDASQLIIKDGEEYLIDCIDGPAIEICGKFEGTYYYLNGQQANFEQTQKIIEVGKNSQKEKEQAESNISVFGVGAAFAAIAATALFANKNTKAAKFDQKNEEKLELRQTKSAIYK